MSDYDRRMDALLLADQHRRWTRQQREDALLSNDSESRAAIEDWHLETPLLRGTGLIPQNPARTKTPNRQPRSRAHGAAAMPQNADQAARLAAGDVEPTVLCYNLNSPDNVEIRTVASFRGSRDSAKNRAPVTVARTVDTARDSVQPSMRHDYN